MVHTMHLADEELLLALDDQLPPVRVAPAQAHLATCAACRSRMQEFHQTSERLGGSSQSDDWMADALRARADPPPIATAGRGSSRLGFVAPALARVSRWCATCRDRAGRRLPRRDGCDVAAFAASHHIDRGRCRGRRTRRLADSVPDARRDTSTPGGGAVPKPPVGTVADSSLGACRGLARLRHGARAGSRV